MSGRAKMFQIVPTTFHGISSGSAISTRQTETPAARARHRQRDGDAERDLDQQDEAGEERAGERARRGSRLVAQHLLEPVDADPEEALFGPKMSCTE